MSTEPENGWLDEDYVLALIRHCDNERAEGKYPQFVSEGDRISGEFRKMFPSVSDQDLGTLIVILVRVLHLVGESPSMKLSSTLDTLVSSYSHAAAVILKDVIGLRGL